ncbi:NAD(P)-binding domain-containing protein [Devosia sp.]|uniref:NAD(P)-binding domain-containing protein n=1 Tax=Devosia sp. TaxID=1871048 RepID=UPI002EF47D75
MRIGFIGTGTITRAVVEGLHHAGREQEILVSQRSESVSADLERRFAGVRRAANAEVAAGSDIVFLAMRPVQVEDALSGVRFKPGQLVISFVTGLSLADLAALAPEATVGRVLPPPAIARGEGPIICYPALPPVLQLLTGLGRLVVPASEAELLALGSVSGFMSSYFELHNALIDWLRQRGVSEDNATTYVAAMLHGLAGTAQAAGATELAGLPAEHETPGGLNQRVRQRLRERGWFQQPAECFAEILSLTRASLD